MKLRKYEVLKKENEIDNILQVTSEWFNKNLLEPEAKKCLEYFDFLSIFTDFLLILF